MQPLCDVIGCRSPAAWKRTATDDDHFEEYLCDTHFAGLMQSHPQPAAQYERLSEEDASQAKSSEQP